MIAPIDDLYDSLSEEYIIDLPSASSAAACLEVIDLRTSYLAKHWSRTDDGPNDTACPQILPTQSAVFCRYQM